MNYTKLWGVGEALPPPNLGKNNSKVLPLKRPSHKPKFKKRRCSFQSSDNGDDEIWGAEKAPPDVGKKRSKASPLEITKTKGQPIAVEELSIGN